ncbi:HD family phosphohydrolase [Alteribacter natronophilus]|uniref:HD family phosphohydrolase n=1 Tax=Alteribacter natronophilus TaxID=2583810 RepID=UPI00110F004D|nr:HD family phosphohydrolase [Alteribacter natronophilus]TMW73856.1 HD family phosphohydrolase [Alteribacter natronophilus]
MGKHSSPIDQQKWWKKLKEHRYIRLSLFVLLGFLLYAAMVSNVIPESLDVSVGSNAEQDIRSPVSIEDREETEQKRQEAAAEVDSVYTFESRYMDSRVEQANVIFDMVSEVAAEAEERQQEIEAFEARQEERGNGEESPEDSGEAGGTADDGAEAPGEPMTEEEQLDRLRALLPTRAAEELDEDVLLALLNLSEEQREDARDVLTNVIATVMNSNIRLDEVEEAREEAMNQVSMSGVERPLLAPLKELAEFSITANYVYDQEATELARQTAVENVDRVEIREGQLLVAEGDPITSEVYNQLTLAGLLDEHINLFPYIGLAILVLIMTSMLGYFLSDAKTSLQTNNTHLLMYVIIFSLGLLVLKLASYGHIVNLTGVTLVAPVAMTVMLITVLLNPRVALFTSMMLAITASVIFNHDSAGVVNYVQGMFVFFSCVGSTFFLIKSHRMVRILQAGLFTAALNILIIVAIMMLRGTQLTILEVSMSAGFAASAGILAAVLTIGLIPFFEAGFGILSTMKLIELSSPNHPLLRKILLDAPGTYHHSVIVANLSEGACEAIGANGLLARVGSYYHDLGKTKRPHFFIENQMKMENPHDKISPRLSRTIIIDHPYDGAAMLREHRMPKEIIDIAEQHHGTTLLKFFYYKAKNETELEVKEEDFRYPGPKAQTRESAVIGIADSVEAAVRSMQHPTPEKIESLVRKIISDRLEDGQFDECDLTMKELNTVARSICETLQGTFHSRIEYPEEIQEKNVEKEKVKIHG